MELSDEQKDRIARNRQRALEVKAGQEGRQRLSQKLPETNTQNSDSPGPILLSTEGVYPYKSQKNTVATRGSTSEHFALTCSHVKGDGDVCKEPVNPNCDLLLRFGEAVCRGCRIDNPHLYELASKHIILADYLIPESTVKMLKSSEKPNPHNPNWTPMRLYLRKHALHWSMDKWQTPEALENERQRRQQEKLDRDSAHADNAVLAFKSLREMCDVDGAVDRQPYSASVSLRDVAADGLSGVAGREATGFLASIAAVEQSLGDSSAQFLEN